MGPYTNSESLFPRRPLVATRRDEWEAAFSDSANADADFATMSGIPLEPVYGPDDGEFPGVYPYTRGPYASMYRSKLWTMRMFAGFGTADDTNWRFKEIIRTGGDGLSTAFDMPTLLGLDSDDPMCEGEVGRCGVAVDTLADMEDLYRGIDLGEITTSMTINSPAAVIFAMYVAQAEAAGVPRARLGGTLQNDILKEYQAQKEFVFPPRQSMRLVRDTITFTAAEMPRWHSVSISGYHIREAGSTAAEELAFTLANGFAYVELAAAAGLPVDAFAPRSELLLQRPHRLLRGDRQVPRRPAHLGPMDAGALRRAGAALDAAAVPHPDRRRVAHRAAARGEHRAHGHRGAGRCARRHAEPAHELDGRGLALPTEKAARIALRTQQVLAYETNVAHVADPLGGSYFVEALTDEMERRAEEIFAHLDELGERVDPRRRDQRHRGELVPGQDRRLGLRARAQVQRRAAHDRRRQPVHRGQRRGRRSTSSRSPTRTRPARSSGSTRCGTTATRPRCERPRPVGPRGRRSRGQPDAGPDRHGQHATPRLGEIMGTLGGVFGRHVEVPTI